MTRTKLSTKMSLLQGDEWDAFASQLDDDSPIPSPTGEGSSSLTPPTAVQENAIAQESPDRAEKATGNSEETFKPKETEAKVEARLAKDMSSSMNTALWIQTAILGVVASIAVHHWLKK